MLITYDNDLLISMGEDGTILIFHFNDFEEKKRSFRDEILLKEIFLKEQVKISEKTRFQKEKCFLF